MSSADAPVDSELLADYVGGALDGTPEKNHVEQLISSSPQWHRAAQDITAGMHAVSRDLASLRDAPAAMPPDVAARFDELLSSQEMAPVAKRARSPRRRRLLRTWAAPVAVAAAALAFFAIVGLPRLATQTGSNAGSAERDTAAGQPQQAMAPPQPVETITTGRRYDRGSLSQAFSAPSLAPGPDIKSGDTRVDSVEELPHALDPGLRDKCLTEVGTARPGKATRVEFAYFDNQPALVISIVAASGEWWFVAGARCGISGADKLYETQVR